MNTKRDETKLLLVEDTKFDEDAAQYYLTAAGYKAISVARSADAARKALEEQKPDLAVIDPRIPRNTGSAEPEHGLALIDDIRVLSVKQIVFTIAISREMMIELLNREIGCVRKQDVLDSDLLGSAIETTLAGGVVYSTTPMAIVKALIANRDKHIDEMGLSAREREVIFLWACAFHAVEDADDQVAARLHIEKDTVAKHRRNAMESLSFHSKAELSAWVVANERTFDDVKRLHPDLFAQV